MSHDGNYGVSPVHVPDVLFDQMPAAEAPAETLPSDVEFGSVRDMLRNAGYHSGRPFCRANAIAVVARKIIEITKGDPVRESVLLAEIPEYRSHGHGRGAPMHRHGHKHPSKYWRPHQSVRECERRLRHA